jgi:hypothetical protein
MAPDPRDLDTALNTWSELGPTAMMGIVCLSLVYVILRVIESRRKR